MLVSWSAGFLDCCQCDRSRRAAGQGGAPAAKRGRTALTCGERLSRLIASCAVSSICRTAAHGVGSSRSALPSFLKRSVAPHVRDVGYATSIETGQRLPRWGCEEGQGGCPATRKSARCQQTRPVRSFCHLSWPVPTDDTASTRTIDRSSAAVAGLRRLADHAANAVAGRLRRRARPQLFAI